MSAPPLRDAPARAARRPSPAATPGGRPARRPSPDVVPGGRPARRRASRAPFACALAVGACLINASACDDKSGTAPPLGAAGAGGGGGAGGRSPGGGDAGAAGHAASGGGGCETMTCGPVGAGGAGAGCGAMTCGAGGASGAGGVCAATPCGEGGAGGVGFEAGEERPGGDVTVDRFDELALSQPAPSLTLERRGLFQTGKAVFEVPWVAAPAPLGDRDGLGPLFNAPSCFACHVRNGRGAPPDPGAPALSLLLRLSVPSARGAPGPDPAYGDQIQTASTGDVPAEGRVTVAYEEVAGAFADGETFSLRRPQFIVENANYGPLPPDALVSARGAPPLVGLGLLAAVAAADVAAAADPDDADGDGISGRVNPLAAAGGAVVAGRFGWKANQPDLAAQNAGALLGDLGLTSPAQPSGPCTAAQAACLAAPAGGDPEVSAGLLEALTFYTATLAVPSRPAAADPEVLAGKAVFHRLGCAACHRPSWVTGAPPGLPELAGQRVWPYTDLLLHDLGAGLADGRPDHGASGREWRTAPLWGFGPGADVAGVAANYLHDGRARSVAEAVLWHGGEAEAAREAFRAASADDRRRLARFVASL